MKKSLIIFLFLLFAQQGNTQNLIPNGDFELGPDSSSAAWLYHVDSTCGVDFYDTVLGPDFWLYTDGEIGRLVHGAPFFNCYDNGLAQSGNVYVMFNWNDGGKTTLITPLQTGKKYRLQYYLGVDTMWYFSPTWAIFTFNNGGNIINSPEITNPGFGVWNKYDTVFTAQANSTEFEIHGNYINGTCIKIDNISLQNDETAIENIINNTSPEIIFDPYLNTVKIVLTNTTATTLKIFNSIGQCIYYSNAKGENTFKIDLSGNMSEIYFITIQTKNAIFSKSIVLTKNK